MGYNLYIGEFEPTIYPEERYARGSVAVEEDVEAAPFNSSNNQSNVIWPSYTGWSNFCEDVGLVALFYADGTRTRHSSRTNSYGPCEKWWTDSKGEKHEGLLSTHPGSAPLERVHLEAFYEARKRWLAEPEEVRAKQTCQWREGEGPEVDWHLRRLDWLIFWTEWALENCKYPTFANS